MSRLLRLLSCLPFGLGLMMATGQAGATAPGHFGWGPRSSALAQADIADPTPVAASFINPAFLAEPGARVAVGYGYGALKLKWNGKDSGLRDISGVHAAVQFARAFGKDVSLGFGGTLYLPDQSLARIAFLPGSEPLWMRYEPSSQRMASEFALALRLGAFRFGLGATMLVSAEGDGVGFKLGQDGNGTYADGKADVTLPYRVSPVAWAAVDLGPASLGLRFRGAQSVGVALETRADVAVEGNPLNGNTTVRLKGTSGYVPATVDLGARYSLSPRLRALVALQYARWSAAPSPAAEMSMDVGLGLTPGQVEGRFSEPRWHDTLSPRVGVEGRVGQGEGPLALRAGYFFSPSPVPSQSGFATHVDTKIHGLALGAGYDLGKLWGVWLRTDVSTQLHILPERSFHKPSDVLPFSTYTASGSIFQGAIAVEGGWR